MSDFLPGQRWVSDSEPDLGLGTIVGVEGRQLAIEFASCGEQRTYAINNAPLSRVRFAAGDSVPAEEGWLLHIHEVVEQGGLIFYKGQDHEGKEAGMLEMELAHHIQFSSPEDRLANGQLSDQRWFDLRYESQQYLAALANSPVQGLLGPRISLIPHQLSIAHDVSERRLPRVLLSDEVGLGKTIEAGLIIHRLITLDRVHRVLILVPDSLMHQWLVEMMRRFNLRFSLFNDERYEAAKESDPDENPFYTEQLVLCSQSLFFHHPEASREVLEAGWDLLTVDEAHHLEWSPEDVSAEYDMVDMLAKIIPSVLLLTATPEQLGVASHFARLRMLDPDRFYDYEKFIEEEADYKGVAGAIDALQGQGELDFEHLPKLRKLLSDPQEKALLSRIISEPDDVSSFAIRQALVGQLIDRHGTGRVVFRNTRANVSGFPDRVYHPIELAPAEGGDVAPWWKNDARIQWLIDFLDQNYDEKVLLICHTRQTAQDIVEALRTLRGINAAAFHEGLSIIERDRAGAWFAEADNGAQLLACSEIGSEGRNFQFAHHLVLFDLPDNPDLLEQRIGRLDRIGQTEQVNIYFPYYPGTVEEAWQRWYHEGLNAFEHSCAIGGAVAEAQHAELDLLRGGMAPEFDDLEQLIESTKALADEQRHKLEEGRDRLLELNSHHPEKATQVISGIEKIEQELALQSYLEQAFDCFGVDSEDHSDDALIIRPGDHMQVGHFPGLPEDGMTATFSRDIAASREDFNYLTWEHPLVSGALDLAVSGDHGTAVVSATSIRGIPKGTVMVEAIYTLQAKRVKGLDMRAYLPMSSLRCLWDYKRRDYGAHLSAEVLADRCENVGVDVARQLLDHQRDQIKGLLKSMASWAKTQQAELVDGARQSMQEKLEGELQRLEALQKVNPNVRDDELEEIRLEIQVANAVLDEAEVKLDAVRVVFVH